MICLFHYYFAQHSFFLFFILLLNDRSDKSPVVISSQLIHWYSILSISLVDELAEDTSKGVALLYVRMNKAMYGMLQSALLFYRKLTSELIDYGFKLNPYDPCVANMEINGFQMTVTWHVDDLKVSHVDPFQITRFAEYLASIYGEKLTVNRGQVHDYLGMDLDYSTKGQVKIGQIRYTKKMIDEFPEPITYSAASPATDYLYTIRNPNYMFTLEYEQDMK
jgi:hypothetical protein